MFMVAPAAAGGLGFKTATAGSIYGTYTMAVYLLAVPGGFIADRILGAKRSVLIGGTAIAAGHYALAMPSLATFYAGLALIALGTGLFKPNISALVGALYGRDDVRRDAGFSLFYMGINIGAFFAPLVTGFLAQSALFKGWLAAAGFDPANSWHWGFGAAGIGMTISMLFFARNCGRPERSRSSVAGTEPARRDIHTRWTHRCDWDFGAAGSGASFRCRRLYVAALDVPHPAFDRDFLWLGPAKPGCPAARRRRHLFHCGNDLLGGLRAGRRRRYRCSPIR